MCGIVMLIFLLEAIFIAITRPYILGSWKRPLFNKIISFIICSFFLSANLTEPNSSYYELIPLGIIMGLMAVLIVAIVGSVLELHEFWSTREETLWIEEKVGPVMTI